MRKPLIVLFLTAMLILTASNISLAGTSVQVVSRDYPALRQVPTWAATIYSRDYENRSNIVFTEAPWGDKMVANLKEMDVLDDQYSLQYRGIWRVYLPDGVNVLVHLFAFNDDGKQWKYFALVPESRWQNRYDRTFAMTTCEKPEDEFVNLISLAGAVEDSYPGQKIYIGAEGKLLVGNSLLAKTRGPRHLLVDGKETTAGRFAVGDTTYMGIKVIAAVLNVDVQYSDDGKEAKVGNTNFRAGLPTKYGVARYEQALVVPLRAFCEAVGVTVTYDPATDTVNILTPDGRGPGQWWDVV